LAAPPASTAAQKTPIPQSETIAASFRRPSTARLCHFEGGIFYHGRDGRHATEKDTLAPIVTDMRLYDLRITVERIEGRSVCGLEVGDFFEVTESSRVRIPEGRHFCLFAMQSVLPLLPAKMRRLPDEDWLEQDSLVACPDPEERLVMRIERIGERTLVTEELT
jgi:uncharacterized repeat protein (TIGR04076 family)